MEERKKAEKNMRRKKKERKTKLEGKREKYIE